MTMTSYQGVVKQGHIQLPSAADLPEGSYVYVIVAGSEPLLAEETARRKATRWLVEYVGNMLLANEGRIQEINGRLAWRFGVFITGRGHAPRGPIGYVDVDAHTGESLVAAQQAEELIAHGTAFINTLP
ncbi:MAG: hypothetical protein R6X32_04460 [Chloroflexota bacterium]